MAMRLRPVRLMVALLSATACRSGGAAANSRSVEVNEVKVFMHELDAVSNSCSHRSAPNWEWNRQSG